MDENECNDLAFAGFEEISFNSQTNGALKLYGREKIRVRMFFSPG